MKVAVAAFSAMLVTECFLDVARASNAWEAYLADLRDRCPAQHVEWICDGCKDDQISGFLDSITEQERRRAMTLASVGLSQKCARVISGFYCEESVYLETFRKLHLLRPYAAYGCRTVTCTESASCSKPPN